MQLSLFDPETYKVVSPAPFLKWVGGKRALIKQIEPYLPKKINRYFEPFLGGGALFFHLQPQEAVLSDVNSDLINCYECVRDRVEEIILLLEEHQNKHCNDYYYQQRQKFNDGDGDRTERAAQVIYINRTCYNGLWRKNSSGGLNTPVGCYVKLNICNPPLLRSASKALQNIDLQALGFRKSMILPQKGDFMYPQKGDFMYLDPPYYGTWTGYSESPFGEAEQILLRNAFVRLASRGVSLMLSNSDCEFIRGLYKEFRIETVTAPRKVNSNGSGRGSVIEVLVLANLK